MFRPVLASVSMMVSAAALAQQPAAPPPSSAPATQGQPGAAQQQPAQRQQCEQTPQRQARRSIMGGLLSGIASTALGQVGGGVGMAASFLPVGQILSDAIMNLLDCREQQQAANATNEAVRGGVGTTTSWTSETRPNVRGSSTASGEERLADGTHCMTVTDIVIVDGEETRAPKRMCRRPGQRGYARA